MNCFTIYLFCTRSLEIGCREQLHMRRWQSGQMHWTVNPTEYSYAGSNPARRTLYKNQLNFLSWAIFIACAESKQTILLVSGFRTAEQCFLSFLERKPVSRVQRSCECNELEKAGRILLGARVQKRAFTLVDAVFVRAPRERAGSTFVRIPKRLVRYFTTERSKISTTYTGHVMTETPARRTILDKALLIVYCLF